MFTKDEVFDILERDKAGELRQKIAAMYETSASNMTLICQGKYYENWFEEWCRLAGNLSDTRAKRKSNKLSEGGVRGVLKDLASGLKQRDIANKYGVSPSTICNIKKGRTHKASVP